VDKLEVNKEDSSATESRRIVVTARKQQLSLKVGVLVTRCPG
jgi:hypothetical protein